MNFNSLRYRLSTPCWCPLTQRSMSIKLGGFLHVYRLQTAMRFQESSFDADPESGGPAYRLWLPMRRTWDVTRSCVGWHPRKDAHPWGRQTDRSSMESFASYLVWMGHSTHTNCPTLNTSLKHVAHPMINISTSVGWETQIFLSPPMALRFQHIKRCS